MEKIVLIAVIITLLTANAAIALPEDDDKIDIPGDWHGKKKIVINKGELTQVVFIKYAKPVVSASEPLIIDIGDPNNDGARDGYELSGLWWNMIKYPSGIPYTINPKTTVKRYSLKQNDVVGAVKNSLEAWDAATSRELYSDYPTVDTRARASTGTPDYKNVITWASISDNSIVAVASMWYYTASNEMVDADITFNTYYRWGIGLSNAMDIQNVGTHEAGHWTGLNDLYDPTYQTMTMYGYTSYGETIRRSLEPGDVAGARAVYGT